MFWIQFNEVEASLLINTVLLKEKKKIGLTSSTGSPAKRKKHHIIKTVIVYSLFTFRLQPVFTFIVTDS